MTTIAQMVSRNVNHSAVLRAIAEGRPCLIGAHEIMTTRRTLKRWGCLESRQVGIGRYEEVVTEKGKAFLAAVSGT